MLRQENLAFHLVSEWHCRSLLCYYQPTNGCVSHLILKNTKLGNPRCTSVTMDMSMRKQMTQQMAATTSRRREPRADLGGNMSMIPVIKPSTPTN